MPALTPYYLTFHGGLRVGTRGVNLEEAGLPVPSDTLYSALVDAYRRSGCDPRDLLLPFLQSPPDPPFLLTSAFPFAGEVRFYPMPVDLIKVFSNQVLAKRGKAVKRIRFFSQKLLEIALSGQNLDEWLFPEAQSEEPRRGVALQEGALWLTVDEICQLPPPFQRTEGRRHALRVLNVWAEAKTPRVTIDRVTSASTIYHSGRITFAEQCGLWFGISWRKDTKEDHQTFEHSLAILEGDGLGGERSAGYGAFSAKPEQPFSLPDVQPGRLTYLLSRYHPATEELPAAMADPQAAYHLAAVGGWLRSPDGPSQRRKRVHLVTEGSLVALGADQFGDLADVTPTYANPDGDLPHRVYRFGLALAAGWPRKEGKHA